MSHFMAARTCLSVQHCFWSHANVLCNVLNNSVRCKANVPLLTLCNYKSVIAIDRSNRTIFKLNFHRNHKGQKGGGSNFGSQGPPPFAWGYCEVRLSFCGLTRWGDCYNNVTDKLRKLNYFSSLVIVKNFKQLNPIVVVDLLLLLSLASWYESLWELIQ